MGSFQTGSLGLSRRDFLAFAGLSSVSLLAGCAVNPVTGRKEISLASEAEELRTDRENAPHQFSADYGTIQDPALTYYLRQVTADLAAVTQRPSIPYDAVPVDAVHVNAYAFPGGSIGLTRGLLVDLGTEAELAAVLGHEMGHINARHTASRMTKGILAGFAVDALADAAGQGKGTETVASGLGGVAAGALLARYSRENEREADRLAIQYMVAAGFNPSGHLGLMELLLSLSAARPRAVELMFATHPMGSERHEASRRAVAAQSAQARGLPDQRQRYMDATASIRASLETIRGIQDAEREMAKGRFEAAAERLDAALKIDSADYAGLLLMARCQLSLKKFGPARRYAQEASAAHPGEPHALHILGIADMALGRYADAQRQFTDYEKALPGNPNTGFFIGLASEKLGDRQKAAQRYAAYLEHAPPGEQADHAGSRLKEWGYIK